MKVGDKVVHDKFGEGIVVKIDGSVATIALGICMELRILLRIIKVLREFSYEYSLLIVCVLFIYYVQYKVFHEKLNLLRILMLSIQYVVLVSLLV